MTLTKEELEQIAEISAKTTSAILDKKAADEKVIRKFTPGAGLEGVVEVTKDEGDKPFTSFGEQLNAIKDAGYIAKGMQRGEIDKRLYGANAKAAQGGSETISADGGFQVAQEFIPNLINRTYNTGVVVSKTMKQKVGDYFNGFKIPAINETSRADGSRFGGIQAYWLAEAGTLTKSKPGFRQISVELQKLIGLCYATDELLQDAVALESYINQWFPQEFGFKLDDACINGDGVGKPLGVLNSPALYAVSAETNQQTATVNAQNIIKMWQSMWAPSRANAVWFINQEVEQQLDQLSLSVGLGGIPVYMSLNMGLTTDGYFQLKGRPVIPIEQCQALGTVGDIILADMGQYIMGDKGGINMATSIHVQFTTDETAFRFTYRCNGQPIWNSTLTPYKGSIKLSPFIALASR